MVQCTENWLKLDLLMTFSTYYMTNQPTNDNSISNSPNDERENPLTQNF